MTRVTGLRNGLSVELHNADRDSGIAKTLFSYEAEDQFTSLCHILNRSYIEREWRDGKYEYLLVARNNSGVIEGILVFSVYNKKDVVLKSYKYNRKFLNWTGIDISKHFEHVEKVAFVHLLCSRNAGKGVGSALLGIIENPFDLKKHLKFEYQAIALRSVVPAFKYYIRRNYVRSLDLVKMYPLFTTTEEQHGHMVGRHIYMGKKMKNKNRVRTYSLTEDDEELYQMVRLVDGDLHKAFVRTICLYQACAPVLPKNYL